jgi:chromatin structure-remodeling complex subunit RSC1/2
VQGHFAEHPLEDVIEKIACQFTARHVRGRPRPPYWHPGWPLYVCDSRYNDRERIFVRIKNWNSCVPEEVRKSAEFMPIYLFERSVYPKRHASPFVSSDSIKGPGGIGDALERGEGERHEGGGIGRKRRKMVSGPGSYSNKNDFTDRLGQTRGLYVGPPIPGAPPPIASQLVPSFTQYEPPSFGPARNEVDRSIVTTSGGASSLGGQVVADRLPSETGTSLYNR